MLEGRKIEGSGLGGGPRLSGVAGQLPPSPIRKLIPLAEGAERRGKQVIYLNIGQPDIPLPDQILDAFRGRVPSLLAYSHSAGLAGVRQSIARYYRGLGIEVDPESEILITAGASEALWFVLRALLDAGDAVMIPEPLYANYVGIVRMVGGRVVPVPTTIAQNFALPDIEAFLSRWTPEVKAILICNPNNPTGTVYSSEMLADLVAFAREKNLWLVADEVYREFLYGGVKTRSLLTFEGVEDHVVVIDSFSKRMSLCGVRTGLLVTRNRQLYDVLLRMGQARLSPPLLGQYLVQLILEEFSWWIDRVVEEFGRRRQVFLEAVRGLPGVRAPVPQGAFYVFAELPVEDSEVFCRWLLTDFLEVGGVDTTVLLAPGAGFYVSGGRGCDQVRIAFVVGVDRLREALEVLARALELYPHKRESAVS